jgi:hypothetical protein
MMDHHNLISITNLTEEFSYRQWTPHWDQDRENYDNRKSIPVVPKKRTLPSCAPFYPNRHRSAPAIAEGAATAAVGPAISSRSCPFSVVLVVPMLKRHDHPW